MNISNLRKQGKKEGFGPIDNADRLRIWLRLVNVTEKEKRHLIKQYHKEKHLQSANISSFYDQIQKDTTRSMNTIDYYKDQEELKKEKQIALERILLGIFNRELRWEYYQGFHDVASLFLTLFKEEDAFVLSYKAGQLYFHDGMNYSFEKSIIIQMDIVFAILQKTDDKFYNDLIDFKRPIFAMPWILTWFMHSIYEMAIVVRLYDYLLSSPPQTIIYLCTSFVYHSKEKLNQFMEGQQDLDFGSKFQFFSNLFKNNKFNVESIISFAERLQFQFPLNKIIKEDKGFLLPNESNVKFINYLSRLKLDNKLSSKEQNFYNGNLMEKQINKRRLYYAQTFFNSSVFTLLFFSQINNQDYKITFFLLIGIHFGLLRLFTRNQKNKYNQYKIDNTKIRNVSIISLSILGSLALKYLIK